MEKRACSHDVKKPSETTKKEKERERVGGRGGGRNDERVKTALTATVHETPQERQRILRVLI